MRISVTEAKAQLTDLVRKPEAGDEVMLTRDGQAAVRLVPPDAVVRLLEVTFLLKIQDCQHEERGRGQGQQRCLHTVEKTCLHGGSSLHQSAL